MSLTVRRLILHRQWQEGNEKVLLVRLRNLLTPDALTEFASDAIMNTRSW